MDVLTEQILRVEVPGAGGVRDSRMMLVFSQHPSSSQQVSRHIGQNAFHRPLNALSTSKKDCGVELHKTFALTSSNPDLTFRMRASSQLCLKCAQKPSRRKACKGTREIRGSFGYMAQGGFGPWCSPSPSRQRSRDPGCLDKLNLGPPQGSPRAPVFWLKVQSSVFYGASAIIKKNLQRKDRGFASIGSGDRRRMYVVAPPLGMSHRHSGSRNI